MKGLAVIAKISKDSLVCHNFYDTGHPFMMAISEDLWHSFISSSHCRIDIVDIEMSTMLIDIDLQCRRCSHFPFVDIVDIVDIAMYF